MIILILVLTLLIHVHLLREPNVSNFAAILASPLMPPSNRSFISICQLKIVGVNPIATPPNSAKTLNT